jgi:two-component system NtrC family sensor kinase
MIVNEATRCKNIVRGLLDFARQSRASKAPAQLPELVDDVITITAPRAEAGGVRVTSEIQPGLPPMLIDGTQIKQMLVNLVDNGIDATAQGGTVKITARLGTGGDSVVMTVHDNGCGIPKENLSKLFTPFFTTKEMGKGTGLGLAIAYGVVKMHSGDISAESQVGKGSTFTIRLPIATEEAQEGIHFIQNHSKAASGEERKS